MRAKLTYPSGRTITYTPNAAGRTLSAVDTANGINYATAAHYAPQGALASLQNGSGVVSTFYFNSRLQPCRISVKSSGTAPTQCSDTTNPGNVLDFSYSFSLGAGDNGNVVSIANNRDTTRSQNFTYDSVNRISTAKTASTTGANCWDEVFGYDPWANLLSIGRVGGYSCTNEELLSLTVNTSNRITNTGFSYDTAGNELGDGVNSYVYDAENHLTTAAGVTYTYDGDGKRVQKSNGKLYWYGMGSDPLDESDGSGNISMEYVFFGGKRIARLQLPAATVNYYFADHLGTSRIVTNSSGVINDDSDFYPFGGERVILSSSGNTYKFTGKERDNESGLDMFGARYYASPMGRFMQTDPKARSAHPLNPQSWNRYAYTLNNPLKYVDPDGMDVVLAAGLSAKDRAYVVNNLARMYATPAGKAMLQRADASNFTITVGTGHLGRTDLTKAPPGTVVFGGQTKVEGGTTTYGVAQADGHKMLVAQSPDSPTAPPIQVTIDKSQAAEIGKDPATVFAHELGGHTADVLNAAESNPNQFIDSVNPKDESSSEAAEKALGKLPNQPSEQDVQAVEEILKPKPSCSTDDKGKKVCSQ